MTFPAVLLGEENQPWKITQWWDCHDQKGFKHRPFSSCPPGRRESTLDINTGIMSAQFKCICMQADSPHKQGVLLNQQHVNVLFVHSTSFPSVFPDSISRFTSFSRDMPLFLLIHFRYCGLVFNLCFKVLYCDSF